MLPVRTCAAAFLVKKADAMDITRAMRDYVTKFINDVAGMKALLLDSETVRPRSAPARLFFRPRIPPPPFFPLGVARAGATSLPSLWTRARAPVPATCARMHALTPDHDRELGVLSDRDSEQGRPAHRDARDKQRRNEAHERRRVCAAHRREHPQACGRTPRAQVQ